MANENAPADRMTLRYFGPDRHADWCPQNPSHEGFCLDELLRAISEQPTLEEIIKGATDG